MSQRREEEKDKQAGAARSNAGMKQPTRFIQRAKLDDAKASASAYNKLAPPSVIDQSKKPLGSSIAGSMEHSD